MFAKSMTIKRRESYQSEGISLCGANHQSDDIGESLNAGVTSNNSEQHMQISFPSQQNRDIDNGAESSLRIRCSSQLNQGVVDYLQCHKSKLVALALFLSLILSPLVVLPRGSVGKVKSSASNIATVEELYCSVQSSYSLSKDLMDLKNSSTIENLSHGAVATDHELCSQIGVSILEKHKGNAADAAVAAALCLGVVNPSSSGLGGGAFILVHSEKKTLDNKVTMPQFIDARKSTEKLLMQNGKITEFIDCRETAPQNASYDMFENLPPEASTLGGLSIAVPGELRGLELLHQRHGSLAWAEVVRPSMELARDGFIVGSHLASIIMKTESDIRKFPKLAIILTKGNDGMTLLKEGDLMIQHQLAKTLEAIMTDGADALYQNDLSRLLSKDIQDAGGIISELDIAEYRPILRDPLIAQNIAGFTVVGAPPPSSGGAAIVGALRFLSYFSIPFSSFADTMSKHHYVEACRHVFAIRMSLSDPGFDEEINIEAVKDLIDTVYIESLRNMTMDNTVLKLSQYGGLKYGKLKDTNVSGALIDSHEGDRSMRKRIMPQRSTRRNLKFFNYLEDHGTSSLSVIDKNRNSVVITSSINLPFGSKIYSPSTGILLNNQMDDFSTPGRTNAFGLHPSESNYVAPGKRPLSSMSPTMVFLDNDGKTPYLSLGASGGPKIITSILQAILNFAFVGMPLYDAVASPRIHNQLLYHGADGTNFENQTLDQGPTIEVPKRTRDALERRGHNLISTDYLGAVQAIAVDLETNTLTAVSDIRKKGMPAGY